MWVFTLYKTYNKTTFENICTYHDASSQIVKITIRNDWIHTVTEGNEFCSVQADKN